MPSTLFQMSLEERVGRSQLALIYNKDPHMREVCCGSTLSASSLADVVVFPLAKHVAFPPFRGAVDLC